MSSPAKTTLQQISGGAVPPAWVYDPTGVIYNYKFYSKVPPASAMPGGGALPYVFPGAKMVVARIREIQNVPDPKGDPWAYVTTIYIADVVCKCKARTDPYGKTFQTREWTLMPQEKVTLDAITTYEKIRTEPNFEEKLLAAARQAALQKYPVTAVGVSGGSR